MRAEKLQSQQILLQRVVNEIVDRAPEGWVRIEIVISCVGRVVAMEFTIFTIDGPFDGAPQIEFPKSAIELRDVMYIQGSGTWFSLSMTIRSSGEVSTAFNYDDRPSYRSSLGHEVREDLEMYPRDIILQWMVDELMQIDVRDEAFQEHTARSSFENSDESDEELEASEPWMERHAAKEMARGFVREDPGWCYVKIIYAERGVRDPLTIFVELDEEGYEFRKVEIFANGLLDFASLSFSGPMTTTSDDPLPSVEELSRLPGVVNAELISPEEFQEEWLVASGPE